MATLRLVNSSGARLLQSSTPFGSRVLGPTAHYGGVAAGIVRPSLAIHSRSFSGGVAAGIVRPSVAIHCRSFSSSYDISSTMVKEELPIMSNEELADTSTIPGWDLIHSPPRKFPRGALVGTVVSDKMTKTVNVAVDRYRIIPKIRKRMRYTRKFMAHDELEVASTGDLVMITPCHRLSKHKHFMVREIIRPKGKL
jgi:small subunit ribosomal protein S17